MFLSRVTVEWRMAQNPYDLHRALWELFPGESPELRTHIEEARSGFLFRVESRQAGRPAQILLQSKTAPQSHGRNARVWASREFIPQPQPDQRLGFLLTANPIKTIRDEEGREGKDGEPKKCRVPLIREAEQVDWLARKLDGAARIESVVVRNDEPLYFRKKRAGKIVPVTFEGILCSRERDQFARLLENGIGPAKAFGCGLMLVRRA